MEVSPLLQEALSILQTYYGYREFRKNQEVVIESILAKQDTVAIMPTGGGKSICYQIPGLLFEGITIVISPLISLMKDQIDSIKELGIQAAYINSSLTNQKISQILQELKRGEIKLLYVAPERLESSDFCELLKTLCISQVAVDEAHCVSQWGHDFRTSYRYIPHFISQLPKRPIVTAFTATATEEVQSDIIHLLKLKAPSVFVSGFDRENLKINVLKIGDRLRYITDFISANKDQSGIIYAATRKAVDAVYEKLISSGIEVGRYHAGLSDDERKKSQEDFAYDRINVMVATNAFGMGIDKSNVRYVIHYNIPKNIEAYYQEIGRAGRDGEISECILLFAPQDVMTQKYLIEIGVQAAPRKSNEYKKLQMMVDFVHYNGCLRSYILRYFGEETSRDACEGCSNCMNQGEQVDKTVDAQKVLSCIHRMKREFGVSMIVDVLRGSAQKKIQQYRFHELSTYGIMKQYSKEQVAGLINTMISHGYISLKEGEYPTVVLNEQSVKILKGEQKVILKESSKAKKITSDNQLFDILRIVRKDIAQREGVPPYFIFADTTLTEMSAKYPVTQSQMLHISGVGQVKYGKYGQLFMDAIIAYAEEHNIQVSRENEKDDENTVEVPKQKMNKKTQQASVEKEATHEISMEMLRVGKTIKQTAEERELTPGTIMKHIEKYISEGHTLNMQIDFAEWFTEEEEKAILEAGNQVGFEKLKPIKEIVPESITYDQIKAFIFKKYLAQQMSK